MKLSHLVHLCTLYEMRWSNIELIHNGFIKWVEEYARWVSLSQTIMYILMKKCYRLFYQHDILRLLACLFSIHALLHIIDGIESAGPVWCYWVFAMEHFCSAVGQHVKNWHDPYTSLDRRVHELAQLQMTKLKYGLMDKLSPKGPVINIRGRGIKFKDGPCRHI